MAKTLEFTQYGGGRYACTFTADGGPSIIQVVRQQPGLIYIEAGADTEHLTYLESAGRFKDVLCEIDVPEGTVVRVVSHTPVEYAAYMAGGGEEQKDYYTKEEVDRKIASITQLQADWNQTDADAADFIKGKPTLVEKLNDLSDVDVTGVNTLQTYFDDAVEDFDGNKYDAVIIGDQVWMAENLRTTHYADGNAISGYYYPGNNQNNKEVYGLLYEWTSIMIGENSSSANPSGVQGIAPVGWHIPSDAEWTQMIDYVNNQASYGPIASALASKQYWESSGTQGSPGYDLGDNNAAGFGAVPAGYYQGIYDQVGFGAYFWGDTVADGVLVLIRSLDRGNTYVGRYVDYVSNAYSVRCVCDLTATEFRAKMALKGKVLMHDGREWKAADVNAIPSIEKGTANGVAELDGNGKVPAAQLPSYVDDVIEGYLYNGAFYGDSAHTTQITGESGKIYIDKDTNKSYRWSGSLYAEVSESLALGETASTAYAGNKGKANAEAIAAMKDGSSIDSFGDVETALSGKAGKVQNATGGNLAGLDANGNITDSGVAPSELHDVRIPGFQSGDEHKVLCVNAAHNGVDLVDITEMAMPPDYLTMTAAVDNSTVHLISQLTSAPNIEYSIGNAPFEEMTWTLSNGTYTSETITLAFGQRVRFRGVNQTLCTDVNTADEKLTRFVLTGGIMASGSVQTLVDKTGATSNAICMKRLFSGNSALLTAPKLPATNLVPGCYDSIFYDDDNLIAPPDELPATVLTPNCYSGYCYNCTKLTHASNLPATVYATMACNSMYSGCTFAMSADGTTFNFIMGLTSIKVGNSTYNTPKAIARDVLRNDTGFN